MVYISQILPALNLSPSIKAKSQHHTRFPYIYQHYIHVCDKYNFIQTHLILGFGLGFDADVDAGVMFGLGFDVGGVSPYFFVHIFFVRIFFRM